MIAYDAAATTTQSDYADVSLLASDAARPVERVNFLGDAAMGKNFLRTFEVQQKVIPIQGGKYALRLYEKSIVSLEDNSEYFQVSGWDMRLPLKDLPQLPRIMSQTFMRLRAKAQANALSEREQTQLVGISDLVDVRQFEIDWAPPHYYEGTLVRRHTSGQVRVEWADGEGSNYDEALALPFENLEAGEKFSAYVKFGRDNKVITIERVTPRV